MSVYKRGGTYWYSFSFAGQRIQESAKTHSRTVAKEAEKKRRRELENGFNNLGEERTARVQSLRQLAADFFADYKLRNPRSAVFASGCFNHIERLLGDKLVADVNDTVVKTYQASRLKEAAAPKTINDEVGFLLRILGDKGDVLRSRLRRQGALRLRGQERIGKVYTQDEKERLASAATVASGKQLANGEPRTRQSTGTRSPFIRPALALLLGTGMRHREVRQLRWAQIDLDKGVLTVRDSKTAAGEGRTVPLVHDTLAVMREHAAWYRTRFGSLTPDWYVFPGRIGSPHPGEPRPYDVNKPITSFKTAWKNVKAKAGVTGRIHDARHTLVTELAEDPNVSEQTIREIVGHVSPQMLARYSHVRMDAKRRALETVVLGARATGENS